MTPPWISSPRSRHPSLADRIVGRFVHAFLIVDKPTTSLVCYLKLIPKRRIVVPMSFYLFHLRLDGESTEFTHQPFDPASHHHDHIDPRLADRLKPRGAW